MSTKTIRITIYGHDVTDLTDALEDAIFEAKDTLGDRPFTIQFVGAEVPAGQAAIYDYLFDVTYEDHE